MSTSTIDHAALIAAYEAGPARLKAALSLVPGEALTWRPAPGKWSAHEVISHCADSESNAYARIRYVLAEDRPTIVGYDQDRWAAALDYLAQPLALSLAVVEAVRAATVPLLKRIPEANWARTATHTEGGDYSAAKWLTIYSDHLEAHAKQLERIVQQWNVARST